MTLAQFQAPHLGPSSRSLPQPLPLTWGLQFSPLHHEDLPLVGVVPTIPGAGCLDQVGPNRLEQCGGVAPRGVGTAGWVPGSHHSLGSHCHKVLRNKPPEHPGAQNHHRSFTFLDLQVGWFDLGSAGLRLRLGIGWNKPSGLGSAGAVQLCARCPAWFPHSNGRDTGGQAEPGAWAQNWSAVVVTSSCWPWWGYRRALQSVGAERAAESRPAR